MAGHGESAASAYRERNSTADKALDILLMFDQEHLSLSAIEVARQLNVARSTAYRYLQSLTQSQFIEEADGGGYQLGRRVLELARLARRGMGLSETALPIMKRLADEVGEAVLLTRLAGSAVICLEREDASNRAVRISYERGETLPINAGASAFVLLAWLADEQIDAILGETSFPAFTRRTLTSTHDIKRRLAETREHGYAVSQGELDPDVLGIAAPLRNESAEVTGAISIAAVAGPTPDKRIPHLAKAVRTAAEEINELLALTG